MKITKSPIHNRVNTIFIPVSDLQAAAKWYCHLLGQEYNPEEVKEPVYNMKINHTTGVLLDAGPPGKKQTVKPSAHPLFNFHTEDIDSSFQFVKELEYSVHSDIQRFEDISFFTIKDADENIIMICTG
ncbi:MULTISPECIES: VOC family protein [Pontibacillus]|uniref:VOC family protein n=1 Tax=Pontibacillus chungwhensis TaxID=265426 RepID=A0ABY8UW16_9BACI|nr:MULTISPECIES: VOC family protein [Pontibacillus]MCD5323177.1 VOC family protein [Pontibacillus sp. HN14]WIF96564.1 VOC family protein [Pontibacillus chungwhensis]